MKENKFTVKKIENKIPMNKVSLQADPCKYSYDRSGWPKPVCLYDCCCDCRPVKDRCSAYKDIHY